MAAPTIPAVHARATLRYLRVSPTKVRPVIDLIRGLAVEDAERLLQLTPRGAGDHVLQLLESAVSNAEHLHAVPAEELFVARCFCDEGPVRSHGRPRARGRYFRTRKRSSHLTIVVARFDEDELEARRRKAERVGAPAGASRRARAERVRRSRAAAAGRDLDHDHDHDHDHEHDEFDEHDGFDADDNGELDETAEEIEELDDELDEALADDDEDDEEHEAGGEETK
jgi:large subunit ribosomal protein L22